MCFHADDASPVPSLTSFADPPVPPTLLRTKAIYDTVLGDVIYVQRAERDMMDDRVQNSVKKWDDLLKQLSARDVKLAFKKSDVWFQYFRSQTNNDWTYRLMVVKNIKDVRNALAYVRRYMISPIARRLALQMTAQSQGFESIEEGSERYLASLPEYRRHLEKANYIGMIRFIQYYFKEKWAKTLQGITHWKTVNF